jgi:hypothetical protein
MIAQDVWAGDALGRVPFGRSLTIVIASGPVHVVAMLLVKLAFTAMHLVRKWAFAD